MVLQATTLAGDVRPAEIREVLCEPDLPRIRLQANDSARPGESVNIQVTPETGTNLVKADISWNGRSLATVVPPFAAVTAQVPTDALPGSQILVEALGTDDQGETVLARAFVNVYGAGALTVETFDDRKGLLITDGGAASLEGGLSSESQALDSHGRAALATAMAQNWVSCCQARLRSGLAQCRAPGWGGAGRCGCSPDTFG